MRLNMNVALKHTFLTMPALIVFLLSSLVFISALSVVYVKSQHRTLFIKQQKLESQRDKIHTEWTQLLLEESTWGSYTRVGNLAKQLKMQAPKARNVHIIDLSSSAK